MKTLFLPVLFASLAFCACNEKQHPAHAANLFPADFDYAHLEGVYSGSFDGTTLYLDLRKVTGRNVVGYSLHRGIKRNVSGQMELVGNMFHLTLKEPGNSPYDGVFDLRMDNSKLDITGTWSPKNNNSLKPVSFGLKKVNIAKDEDYSENYPTFYDSLHTIGFNENGQCRYEFYDPRDTTANRQMIILHGTWTRVNSVFTIDWEQNEILKGRTTLAMDSTKSVSTYDSTVYYTKFVVMDSAKLRQADLY